MCDHISIVKSRVQHCVEAEGLRPFARRVGLPVGVVRSVQAGRDISASNLIAICEVLGLEFYIGPKRDVAPPPASETAPRSIRRWIALKLCPELREGGARHVAAERGGSAADIVALAEAYAHARQISLKSVSLYAAKRGNFLTELKEGKRTITLKRRDAILQWFSDNWPADLVWPTDIPRPSRSKAGRGEGC